MPFDRIAGTELASLVGILAKGGNLLKTQTSYYLTMQIIFYSQKKMKIENKKYSLCLYYRYTQQNIVQKAVVSFTKNVKNV